MNPNEFCSERGAGVNDTDSDGAEHVDKGCFCSSQDHANQL